ncbi:MAG TPA: tyrosine-type recombinase/integrase [bacterium]|nr:tyrosine-type recombinase/integrase [bacterium]
MRLVALEKEEVLRLLEAAKRHGPRAHAMVLLAIRHGLRVSEVTGMRVEHVNVKEGWIRVERLKGSLTTVQTLERHPGQPLLDEVRVLSRWLRARRERRPVRLLPRRPDEPLDLRPTLAAPGRGGRPAAGRSVRPRSTAP